MARQPPRKDDGGVERLLGILAAPETAASVLATCALLWARLPGSRLDLLHPRPAVDPSFMPTEEVWTESRRIAFEAECDAVLVAMQEGLAAWPGPGEAPPLRVVLGKVGEVVATAAAATDLLVIGPTVATRRFETKDAIYAALFDAAAAVLLAPRLAPTALGEQVAIAWEHSEAAEQAATAAMPLLRSARTVTVLVAREGHERTVVPARLLQALEAAGIATTISRFGLKGRDIGQALLDEARAVKADLMVMGAFSHNRVMEALFGGATREVLAGVDMPLLLHH